MKWVKSSLCFLRAEAQLLWVLCLKVFLGLYLRVRGKSMSLNSREKLEQMIISYDSKINWLKVVIQSLYLIVGGGLLVAVSVLTACASSPVRFFPEQNSYRSATQQEKEERNGYLDYSPTHHRKTQSFFLLDTSPIWDRPRSVRY